jgi:hypothetical protein
MLPLIARNHVDRLLEQIESIGRGVETGREVEVLIDKGLCTGIKQRVDIGLHPTTLLNGLKLGVEVV